MYNSLTMTPTKLGEQKFLSYLLKSDDQLDCVEVEMMKNNDIPGILGFSDTRNNEDITLLYDISQKLTLRQFFGGIVGWEDLCSIVLRILETLSESEQYMMDADHFLLSAEQIFVDVESRKAELIFLPMECPGAATVKWRQFLLEELNDIHYDTRDDLENLAVLKALLSDDSVSMTEILEKIQSRSMSKKAVSDTEKSEAKPMNIKSSGKEFSSFVPGSGTEQKTPSFNIPNVAAQADYIDIGANKGKSSNGILGDLFGKKHKKEKKSVAVKSSKAAVKQTPKSVSAPGRPGFEIPGQSQEGKISNGTGVKEKSSKGVFPVSGVKKNEKAVPVQEIGETVLADGTESAFAPYLVEKRTGRKIPINKQEFLVGRERDHVDLVLTNETVGRLHASIVLDPQGKRVYIRDANSKNGTYINGSTARIQSNINIPFEDGAVVCFGKGKERDEFVLHIN